MFLQTKTTFPITLLSLPCLRIINMLEVIFYISFSLSTLMSAEALKVKCRADSDRGQRSARSYCYSSYFIIVLMGYWCNSPEALQPRRRPLQPLVCHYRPQSKSAWQNKQHADGSAVWSWKCEVCPERYWALICELTGQDFHFTFIRPCRCKLTVPLCKYEQVHKETANKTDETLSDLLQENTFNQFNQFDVWA